MTGWRSDKELLEFVDELEKRLKDRPDLMPDAWYWLSLNVDSELCFDDVNRPIQISDDDFIAWIKTEPERLARRIESHRRLRQAYADRIVELDREISVLSSDR